MRILTDTAVLLCEHMGKVGIAASQGFVRIQGRPVLVHADPEAKGISGCPNANPVAGIKPCTGTLAVSEGYSPWIHIDGRRVCLDTVVGKTDGTPAGVPRYRVASPGQQFVEVRS